jgi:hypothetical protein
LVQTLAGCSWAVHAVRNEVAVVRIVAAAAVRTEDGFVAAAHIAGEPVVAAARIAGGPAVRTSGVLLYCHC